MITCSRSFSWWLNIFGLPVSGAVLSGRGKSVGCFIFLYPDCGGFLRPAAEADQSFGNCPEQPVAYDLFLYCFISILWSDFPFVAFKRWIKVLGLPIMALIVLTEPDREEAVTRLMKRCAYVIVPVSILFIKYYPQWGRSFDLERGAMNTGITENKNMFGGRPSDPGFLFLLAFAANLANGADHLEATRASADRRVPDRYLVAFFAGAQCHIFHISFYRGTDGRVCRHPFYK